ncbi:MAG: hypothetical protein IPJ49_23825 [Candidatus Obscuribacter sp.]|nr:hypothetical protein [Candidatus Obscuribacter sp.]
MSHRGRISQLEERIGELGGTLDPGMRLNNPLNGSRQLERGENRARQTSDRFNRAGRRRT